MILQIALDTPLRRVFDYRPPAGFLGANFDAANSNRPLRPGLRVRVPFGLGYSAEEQEQLVLVAAPVIHYLRATG